jgi:DNA-binding transcriptional LysR family regulator
MAALGGLPRESRGPGAGQGGAGPPAEGRLHHMKLRQVEIFCAVMRCRTTLAAAFELGVTQPAISAAIKHMEAQLGLVLFERVGNRLVPTVEAQALYRDAEPLAAMARGLAARVQDLRHARRGHLRIIATQAVGRSIVAGALARFLERRRNVRVYFDVRRMEGVVESIESGFADLGIALAPASRPGITAEPVLAGRMVVALPLGHRRAPQAMLTPGDLQQERLVGLEAASRLGSLVRQAFDDAGMPYRPATEVRHGVTACMLVERGLGVAVVDEFSAAPGHGWRIERRPFQPTLSINACVMHLRGRPLSRLAARFLAELREAACPAARADLSRDGAQDHGPPPPPP